MGGRRLRRTRKSRLSSDPGGVLVSHQSVVYSYIVEHAPNHANNIASLSVFEFDEVYPFSNTFWSDSPAQFNGSVIGFTGSFKEIEYDWTEWLWKFSQLLSALDATNATVELECNLGHFAWSLWPDSWNRASTRPSFPQQLPSSFRGEQWGIYAASKNDFTLLSPWNESDWVRDGMGNVPRWIYRVNEQFAHA